MKRSEINSAIARAIANAKKSGVALPIWVDWKPEQFEANADGIRQQMLGWKVVDFGIGNFDACGLVVLVLTNSLIDSSGEPLREPGVTGGRSYPVTSFARKYLFVQAGQTEPHHFHRQKQRKEVSMIAGGRVRFELAWADGDDALSSRDVQVQVDGIWHQLPANGEIFLQAGQTITLPGGLSHIIQVEAGDKDAILLETSTANNDRTDNIFPFITPSSEPIDEDQEVRYQLLDEHLTVPVR